MVLGNYNLIGDWENGGTTENKTLVYTLVMGYYLRNGYMGNTELTLNITYILTKVMW